MKRFAWLAILTLLAIPAQGGWDSDEDGTGNDCETNQPNPTQQRRCWWNFTNSDGTGNSNLLSIRECENFSFAFRQDFDGAGTTATIKAYICLDDACNTNACYVLENVTLDGNASTNTEAVYGADGTWACVDIIVAAAAGENARVEFRCNQ